jgi:hypothetical protein
MLVDLHPSLVSGVVGGVATTSLPDEARMNNLLRLQSGEVRLLSIVAACSRLGRLGAPDRPERVG